MVTLAEKLDPKTVEQDARSLWAAQRLPPPSGMVGPAEGPVVHQFEGAFAPQEAGMLAVQRAVAADVDARAMILMGRRATGILRREESGPATSTPRLVPLLSSLGVWVGGIEGRIWDDSPRRAEVQTLVGRLAHMGAVAVRDVSLRICPACATARSPERLIYQEEDGQTLLVRFPFQYGERTVSALVWADAAWRLLGTSVLMVHPDLPYVIARYRRRGAEEFIFTSKSSLDRIRNWLPGAEFEILEEQPGRHWEGQTYLHPLRHEFPMGGSMEPPAGTIVPVADVSDTGTGVVPLVPGHGGTDTQIADRLGVPGWPLVTPKGRFDVLLVHKYSGLELESATEFAERDLDEEGAIFARLQVRRGVPHCSRCGTALIWAPGRAWCLEPSRLPPDRVSIYRSLLPNDRPIERLEAVPWPVSEPQRSDDPHAITLLECTSCDRLESTEDTAERCPCGGRRKPVRRRLLPAFDTAASAWAGVDPFPAADSVRLYVNERRRAPTLVHHIAAMSGVAGIPGEVRLSVLPTVPETDFAELLASRGADAVRCALVRAQASEGATATFPERALQEARRLAAFWSAARDVLGRVDGTALASYGQPIAGFLGELEPEDRALLARFESLRIQCLVDYDRSAPGLVHRRLFQFLENDLVTYLRWVGPRLSLEGTPPSKRAALRTLLHVVSSSTLILGPIAPHFAEAIHRALRRSRASLFEEAALGVDRSLLDEFRAKSWQRWVSIVRAVERTRRQLHMPPDELLPTIVLIVGDESTANELRAEAPVLGRLARVQKVEVGSPGAPWGGRRRELRPRESEIQRVYPSRATQLIHLLRRMPERKAADLTTAQGFTMVVSGQPTQIMSSMVEWIETVPEHFVPVAWSAGELYAELPVGRVPSGIPPPPLSADGFQLVQRIAQRLRTRAHGSRPTVIVAAGGPLGSEIAGLSEAISKHLGLAELRVVASDAELPRTGRGFGRTKAGAPWSFHVAGLALSERPPKSHPARPRGARVRPVFAPGELAPIVTNYADDAIVAREAAIRSLGEELDQILGAPLLGPAKVGIAWDAGLQSVDAFREAPWITLAALPGFGTPIASALVTKFGGIVPPLPPRIGRTAPEEVDDNGSGASLDPSRWTEPRARKRAPQPAAPATSPIVPPPPVEVLRAPEAPPSLPPVTPEPVLPLEEPPTTVDREGAAPDATVPAPEATPSETPEPVELAEDSPPEIASTSPLPEISPEPNVEVAAEPEVPPTGETGAAENPPPEMAAPNPDDRAATETPLPPTEPAVAEEWALTPPVVEATEAPAPTASPPPDGANLETPETPLSAMEPKETAEISSSPPLPVEPTIESVAAPGVPIEKDAPEATDLGGVETHDAEPPSIPMQPAPEASVIREAPVPEPTPAPSENPPEESAASDSISENLPLPEPSEEVGPALGPAAPDSTEPDVAFPPVPPIVAPPADEAASTTADSPSSPPELDSAASSESAPVALEQIAPPVIGEVAPPMIPETIPEPAVPVPLEPEEPASPGPAEPASPETTEPTVPVPVDSGAPAAPSSPASVEPAPVPPAGLPLPPSPPAPKAPEGGIDLTVGPSYIPALERFLEATAAGHQGLCVVRDSPERVRAHIGSRPVELRWLSNIGRGPTLKPNDLEGFAAFLAHSVSSGQVTAFFIEGMEYLVRIHGLEKVVQRMVDFDRLAREHSARAWVPLNPQLLSPAELDRFVAAFTNRAPEA